MEEGHDQDLSLENINFHLNTRFTERLWHIFNFLLQRPTVPTTTYTRSSGGIQLSIWLMRNMNLSICNSDRMLPISYADRC